MSPKTSFGSSFADMMARFVVHKQMQGLDYAAQTNSLKFFDRFLCSEDCSGGLLRSEHFFGYLESLTHIKLKTREGRLGVVHQFSLYLNAFRPESRVMPLRLLPPIEQSIRFCRITTTEVGVLMDAAGELHPKIRAACIRFLIGLLYATGLRISEAINLNLGDVDLERNTLFVHRGKFGKDRLIALDASTTEALKAWLDLRSFHAGSGNSAPLLVGAPNKRLSYQPAKRVFRKLCIQCGLHGDPLPRLHDLRHNYACECLVRWRREGKDIQTLLPVLSAAKSSLLDSLPVGGTRIVKNPRASEWIVFGSGSQPFTKIKLENGSRLGDRRALSLNTFFSSRGDAPVNIERSWDNFCRILSESGWGEQREAIQALINSDLLIPADNLRRLYNLKEEMGHDVKDVEELILEKGDAALSDLYMSILKPDLRKSRSVDGERFLRKICSVSDTETIADAVEYALENGAYHELARSLSFIAKAGLDKQCVAVAEWCLSNEKYEREVLLCTGILPDFDENRILPYLNHDNLQLQAAALRALESRYRNGHYLEKIQAGCSLIIQNFEGDRIAWDALEFVDGMLEFGDRDEAIAALKQIHDKIIDQHVFPKRAAWERLRVFGEEPHHEVFSGLPRIRPYPWPTKSEPFFGIGAGDSCAKGCDV